MRLKLISCEVFSREMAAAVSRCANDVDAEFLPGGLHRSGCGRMRRTLQEALDRTEEVHYQAVLLAYGVCHGGILGLRAGAIPLVLPRVGDCSSILAGGKQRYSGYAHSHPAALFRRGKGPEGCRLGLPDRASGWGAAGGVRGCVHPDLNSALKAGEDWFLPAAAAEAETSLGSPDYVAFHAEKEAEWFGWDFERATSDLRMIQRFVDGYWSHHEFLVVPPGHQVATATGQERIRAEEIPHE